MTHAADLTHRVTGARTSVNPGRRLRASPELAPVRLGNRAKGVETRTSSRVAGPTVPRTRLACLADTSAPGVATSETSACRRLRPHRRARTNTDVDRAAQIRGDASGPRLRAFPPTAGTHRARPRRPRPASCNAEAPGAQQRSAPVRVRRRWIVDATNTREQNTARSAAARTAGPDTVTATGLAAPVRIVGRLIDGRKTRGHRSSYRTGHVVTASGSGVAGTPRCRAGGRRPTRRRSFPATGQRCISAGRPSGSEFASDAKHRQNVAPKRFAGHVRCRSATPV